MILSDSFLWLLWSFFVLVPGWLNPIEVIDVRAFDHRALEWIRREHVHQIDFVVSETGVRDTLRSIAVYSGSDQIRLCERRIGDTAAYSLRDSLLWIRSPRGNWRMYRDSNDRTTHVVEDWLGVRTNHVYQYSTSRAGVLNARIRSMDSEGGVISTIDIYYSQSGEPDSIFARILDTSVVDRRFLVNRDSIGRPRLLVEDDYGRLTVDSIWYFGDNSIEVRSYRFQGDEQIPLQTLTIHQVSAQSVDRHERSVYEFEPISRKLHERITRTDLPSIDCYTLFDANWIPVRREWWQSGSITRREEVLFR